MPTTPTAHREPRDINPANPEQPTRAARKRAAKASRGNLRTWVARAGDRAKEWKNALVHHVVTHDFISYGDPILLGSGTTPIYLMKGIVTAQITKGEAPDLAIVTSNLQVLYAVRDAQRNNADIFGNTQVILTGGRLNSSLDSLIGDDAVRAIMGDWFSVRTVFFGAAGLTFKGGLNISFQFEEEISTQVAFATRPTSKRVLLVDHTKLGKPSFSRANLNLDSLMKDAEICYVITTVDKKDPESMALVQSEGRALEDLLAPLRKKKEYEGKDFVYRVINGENAVEFEVRLQETKQAHRNHTGRVKMVS
jgi:DeoR/GlpR family transcriptional regulator of sugar metabolism